LLYEKLLCTFYVLQNQVSHISQFDDDAEKISQISFGGGQSRHLIISHFFKKINYFTKNSCGAEFHFEVLHLFYLEEKQCQNTN